MNKIILNVNLPHKKMKDVKKIGLKKSFAKKVIVLIVLVLQDMLMDMNIIKI